MPTKPPDRPWLPSAPAAGLRPPRPHLLPVARRFAAAQPRPASSWPGAPRPDLLPAMPVARPAAQNTAQAKAIPWAIAQTKPIPPASSMPRPPPARVAQAMQMDGPTVTHCKHCNSFLGAEALLETGAVKVTRCIFTSSLYVISKQHREADTLEFAIGHLHHTVQIAEALSDGSLTITGYPATYWQQNITHVVMNIGPTKPKAGNNYNGYEHCHAFIVLNPATGHTFQNPSTPSTQWAWNTLVGTVLNGNISRIKYAPDNYTLAVEDMYQQRLSTQGYVNGLTPVYFSIDFENGKAKTTSFAV